jgi:hypothetical protein
MRPFKLSEHAKRLKGSYPRSELLLEVVANADDLEKLGIVQQWVTEGIPYSFREHPILYESIRRWLGRELGIHAKEITLIGSARIGYSMAPPPDYGQLFSSSSDLDFSAISECLFQRCVEAFDRWVADYTSGEAVPRHPTEEFFWQNNREVVPNNIRRGFIDPHKIPTLKRYQVACDILDSLYRLHEKLKVTDDAPQVRKITIRVFKAWGTALRQFKFNLSLIAKNVSL